MKAYAKFIALTLLIGATASSFAQIESAKPRITELDQDAFPALGAGPQRKVHVEFNCFYDHAGIGSILAQLEKAFPELTRLYSIGKSVEGRDLWCLEITSRNVGDPSRKPGMYIDGNIHGNEVQAGEVVLYTAWYLCHQYGRLAKVTELLDNRVFYLIPTINPDGRDHWFHNAQSPHSSRTGLMPTDNDRDGVMDEDDADDLNGDGSITWMRIKDPNGRYKPHPDFPKYLMVPCEPDEPGEYTLLGPEGLDNDGDGLVNEDPPGGYDTNRNWAWDWQPDYIQYGAKDYPFELPEPRAIARFIIAHPNIAAGQSFHNNGGMILRGPGREGGIVNASDDQVMRFIGERGTKILPFYTNFTIWKDLYTTWGNEVDWFYGARGILTFTNELYTPHNIDKGAKEPSTEDQAAFMKHVLLDDGIVEWKEFDHPTYGKIEIGGTRKEWSRVPPSFLLEEECHRNMAFTLYHADAMPMLKISEVKTEKLDSNLYKVWVTVENSRMIPTRSAQDTANHISAPDIVSLAGPGVKVLSSGQVMDRFFKRVEAVKRRPERVEVETIGGMSATRVQFIVSGKGAFTVTVDSTKGGLLKSEAVLP